MVQAEQRSSERFLDKRTVWGYWPILLSIWVAVGTALPLLGILSAGRQAASQQASAHIVALFPISVLIGLSMLIASRVSAGWQRQLAMWSAFVAVVVVAATAR